MWKEWKYADNSNDGPKPFWWIVLQSRDLFVYQILVSLVERAKKKTKPPMSVNARKATTGNIARKVCVGSLLKTQITCILLLFSYFVWVKKTKQKSNNKFKLITGTADYCIYCRCDAFIYNKPSQLAER